jgi:MOSC domain-containing protein YiiM
MSKDTMQLLSINVGQPEKVKYKGKQVSTSIFKTPVKGPVKVNTLNLEGDRQADLTVHGGVYKAVYLYPTEHLDYWRRQYPEKQFNYGSFGENLSTSGLLETDICIGDQLRIGSAEFSVTSPRFPCFKLGIKMNDSGIIKAFMQANRSGFYLMVLKEGVISPGQGIELIGNDGYHFSIEEFSRLYALDRHNRSLLQKAINAPSLTDDWKEFFTGRLQTD